MLMMHEVRADGACLGQRSCKKSVWIFDYRFGSLTVSLRLASVIYELLLGMRLYRYVAWPE